MKFKKIFYIVAFTFLGSLLSFLAHVGIEIGVIALLEKDFTRFSLGLTWDQLLLIHYIFTILLAAAGLVFGFYQGRYWWGRLYEHKNA